METGSDVAVLLTHSGQARLSLEFADQFVSRLRGLMLRRPLATEPVPDALLITRCGSVQTCFMRYPIDVVYLGDQGQVLKIVPALLAWRFSLGGWRARHALELPAGLAARVGLAVGDRLRSARMGWDAQGESHAQEQSPVG